MFDKEFEELGFEYVLKNITTEEAIQKEETAISEVCF